MKLRALWTDVVIVALASFAFGWRGAALACLGLACVDFIAWLRA